ncbi:XRE family transcriptional regulator OS=Streptomyces alboniger OX=132473 GN=CP975_08300 PE=4 SV=1 [Streptomyces alboniger]
MTELLFDTRFRAGNTHLFRYGVEDGTAGVSREYVRGFGTAGAVRAPGADEDVAALPVVPPVHAALSGGTARRPAGAGAQRTAPLVHHVEPRVRSGMLGIGWDWE